MFTVNQLSILSRHGTVQEVLGVRIDSQVVLSPMLVNSYTFMSLKL